MTARPCQWWPGWVWPRLAVALALGLALAGCSSSGDNTARRLGGLIKGSLFGVAAPAPAVALTRARLDRIPFATIALRFGAAERSFLVPRADNGGYLSYLDRAGHGLVMLGGAVAATLALGQDLAAVRHQADDPIAYPTPLADWPDRVMRDYQFTLRDGAGYAITLACVYQRLAGETIEIIEIDFEVVRIGEICTNARRQFTNTYWVEAETGFIWKSSQWLGPHLDPVTIEIIRPYGG